ncbi:hypothetical protein CASFOL_039062 [Castilleja foliolosa]|uniref:Uncharacterized protein n=1 Tax=Castilleja foliolosa TaxID=1961234 RepID=A0ABD3BHH8_9LAMI
MQLLQEPSVNLRFYVLRPISGSGPHQSFQMKTEEEMELKRNISESHISSASACSDPKRRATPSEDSPIAQIFNDSSLDRKLVSYSNDKTAAERVNLMMEDPWLEYILGDRVSGSKISAILRGFLSIFIAYWNMDDLIIKYKLGTYRLSPNQFTTEDHRKIDELKYVIEHVKDFRNLKEVLYSKYGSDPVLAAKVFEKLKKISS